MIPDDARYLKLDGRPDDDPGDQAEAFLVMAFRVHGSADIAELEALSVAFAQAIDALVADHPHIEDLGCSPLAVTAGLLHVQGVARAYLQLARQTAGAEGDAYARDQLHKAAEAVDRIMDQTGDAEPMRGPDADAGG